jgi:predicted amidophosphoribosyltransferase
VNGPRKGSKTMAIRPPSSRNTLKWHVFEERGPGEWVLHFLPPYYASLFEEQEPVIMKKSRAGWLLNRKGSTKYTFLKNLTKEEIGRIQQFVTDYTQFVILDLNKNIENSFFDELDSCVACDYTAESPDHLYKDIRTPMGHLCYQYKYERNRRVIDKIADEMERCLWRLPCLDRIQKHSLSFIPPRPNKALDLPRDLAEILANRLQSSGLLSEDDPILYPSLVIDKPEFKDLTWDRKQEVWNRIYSSGAVQLSGSVKGERIIVIDDLYQSGNTMWSYARYLKAQGALVVHGLVCVKTLRDTDNR